MSRRDRADGSAPPRSAPRERFGGRDRADAPAAPRSAPRERTHRGPETAVEMTDGPAEQARDLDQLVAELRDLEAYNQRQERVLRRMQRSRERDGLRTQTDHTAGGSNADEFFNRRSSSGGGGARSVQDPHLPQSLRQRTRDGTRGGTSTRRPRRAATPPRHLRRESTDFVTSDDPDYDLTGDVESDENERLPPSGGRVHHVRVTEVDHDVDPFDSPLFTSGHPRRSTTGSGRGRVQPSGGDYDQLVDEVGELARSVSHLTRYVERLGATPPRRSVSRGGVPRRQGSAGGVRDTHSVGGGAHAQHRSNWTYADESVSHRRRSDTHAHVSAQGRIHFREPSRSPPDSAIDWEDNAHLHGLGLGFDPSSHVNHGGSLRYDRPLSPHRSDVVHSIFDQLELMRERRLSRGGGGEVRANSRRGRNEVRERDTRRSLTPAPGHRDGGAVGRTAPEGPRRHADDGPPRGCTATKPQVVTDHNPVILIQTGHLPGGRGNPPGTTPRMSATRWTIPTIPQKTTIPRTTLTG